MNFKKPAFWDLPKPNFISYLLIPFSLPIILKNFLFQFLIKEKSSKIKTICVGNIYIGGTGKTPLTIKIYEILKKLDNKVATVKKDHSNQKDEQLLLKQKTYDILYCCAVGSPPGTINKRHTAKLIVIDALSVIKYWHPCDFFFNQTIICSRHGGALPNHNPELPAPGPCCGGHKNRESFLTKEESASWRKVMLALQSRR